MEQINVDTFMPQTAPNPPTTPPSPVDQTANVHPSAKAQHILAFLENCSHDQVDAFVG